MYRGAAMLSVLRWTHDLITNNDLNILGMLNIMEAVKEFEIKRLECALSSSLYTSIESLRK